MLATSRMAITAGNFIADLDLEQNPLQGNHEELARLDNPNGRLPVVLARRTHCNPEGCPARNVQTPIPGISAARRPWAARGVALPFRSKHQLPHSARTLP